MSRTAPCMAASAITKCVCEWGMCCEVLWVVGRLEKCYRNASPSQTQSDQTPLKFSFALLMEDIIDPVRHCLLSVSWYLLAYSVLDTIELSLSDFRKLSSYELVTCSLGDKQSSLVNMNVTAFWSLPSFQSFKCILPTLCLISIWQPCWIGSKIPWIDCLW